MQRNIKLTIAYDGTAYQGWQDSIEKALRNELEKILQHPIYLQAASRTDAGVHADGQIVNFKTAKPVDYQKLFIALNQLLPKDIVIRNIACMPDSFHPTLDAIGKEYRYYICNNKVQLPAHRFYSWHVHQGLDFEAMRAGARILIGKHDFSAFCNQGSDSCYAHHVRQVTALELRPLNDGRYFFLIKGNSFLYKMVRNMVGTLVDIGRGKIALESLPQILSSCDRTQAGVTAPAHGLFLHEVFYSEENRDIH